MSKVVVLLHFADPSFFPCRPRPPKKLTWGEMKKKARQTVGAIFLPPEWCMRRSADAAPPPYSWENCRDYFCVLHNPFNFFLQASAGSPTLFAETIRFWWGHQSQSICNFNRCHHKWMRHWPCYVLLPNKDWWQFCSEHFPIHHSSLVGHAHQKNSLGGKWRKRPDRQ